MQPGLAACHRACVAHDIALNWPGETIKPALASRPAYIQPELRRGAGWAQPQLPEAHSESLLVSVPPNLDPRSQAERCVCQCGGHGARRGAAAARLQLVPLFQHFLLLHGCPLCPRFPQLIPCTAPRQCLPLRSHARRFITRVCRLGGGDAERLKAAQARAKLTRESLVEGRVGPQAAVERVSWLEPAQQPTTLSAKTLRCSKLQSRTTRASVVGSS
eukprot:370054-Rhodomonas_salina.2